MQCKVGEEASSAFPRSESCESHREKIAGKYQAVGTLIVRGPSFVSTQRMTLYYLMKNTNWLCRTHDSKIPLHLN